MVVEKLAPPTETLWVSEEEYLEKYAAHYYEWAAGRLISISPTTLRHWQIQAYLLYLLNTYLQLTQLGQVLTAPMVMWLDLEPAPSRREPDVMVVLNESLGRLSQTRLVGPADLCVEIVSEESASRDFGDKFVEYEQAGVREYWILDPLREEARFYRLGDHGRYQPQYAGADGLYRTPLLPGFALAVAHLWQDPPPNMLQAIEFVRAQLGA